VLLPIINLVRIQGGSSISLNLHPGKSISDISGRAEGFRSTMELFVKVQVRLFVFILSHTLG